MKPIATIGISETLSLIEQDIAEGIIEEDGNYARLHHIMAILAAIMENPSHLERTLKIVLAFDGNVAAASRALGIAPRPCGITRPTLCAWPRLSIVLWMLMSDWPPQGGGTEGVTVEDLLDCLPGKEANLPSGFSLLVSMIATGTDLKASAVAALGEQLGISHSLSRDYYNQTLKMLSVAKLVIDRNLEIHKPMNV